MRRSRQAGASARASQTGARPNPSAPKSQPPRPRDVPGFPCFPKFGRVKTPASGWRRRDWDQRDGRRCILHPAAEGSDHSAKAARRAGAIRITPDKGSSRYLCRRSTRQLEGIAKAKAAGVYKGRPASIDAAQVRELKAQGKGAPRKSRRRLRSDGRRSYRVLEAR
jgi:hypothetical protein